MQLSKAEKYQNRLIMVFLGIIVVLFFSWNGAFKKTIVAYRDLNKLERSIRTIDQSHSRKIELINEIKRLDAVLGVGEDKIPAESVFEALVSICKDYEKIRLINFPDIHRTETSGYMVTTVFAVFEGNYADLLELVYNIERNNKIGRLVSIDFIKKNDIKKDNDFLHLTILLQKYELIGKQ